MAATVQWMHRRIFSLVRETSIEGETPRNTSMRSNTHVRTYVRALTIDQLVSPIRLFIQSVERASSQFNQPAAK